MWFDFVFLESFNCNSEFTKLWQILWQFYQKIFLYSWACESCYSKSGYPCPGWSWVGIRDSQVKSGQSRLIRDAWTLCKGFWGVRGHAPREKKIRNLRFLNRWKCITFVNLTITVLFLYHFKYFTIPSGGPFWLLGGGGGVRAHPAHPPPAYGPE